MVFRPSERQMREFDRLIAAYEVIVRDAFIEVVEGIVTNADFERLVQAIKDNRASDVLRSIGIQEGSFINFDIALTQAFSAGGVATMAAMPIVRDSHGFKVNFQFNARNLRAERRLRLYVRGLIQDFKQEAEAVVRFTLAEGLKQGRNPRHVAQELIGTYNRAKRVREGGLLGLNRNQSQYVINARMELESGSSAMLRRYLNRTRRDKRFDRTILKAIQTGEPLPDSVINNLTRRYSDRLLISRANTIGQTEAMEALNASRLEASSQMAEQTGTDPDKAVKVWKSASDSRTREQHAAMNGAEVVGIDTPFTMPDGSQMLHPCDTSLGAGASQTVNCRCSFFVRLNYFTRA